MKRVVESNHNIQTRTRALELKRYLNILAQRPSKSNQSCINISTETRAGSQYSGSQRTETVLILE